MILGLAAIVAAGIVLPHALRLQQVHPVTATVLWLSSIALRALTGVLAVIGLLFFLPRTRLFTAVTHWCLDVAVPFFGDELHVEGHRVGDLALLVPGIALAFSVLYTCHRTAGSARRARRLIARDALGHGPRDTLIVGGRDVSLAVAGLVHPRIVVSAGALTSLDDEELDAALDHEQAHIVRRHRLVLLLAIALAAFGRAVPGTQQAVRELAFHLERDADRWALKRTGNRLALASAICKAATGGTIAPPGIAALGSTGVRERLRQLTAEHPAAQTRPARAALNALAGAMVAGALMLTAAVPAAAAAGVRDDAHRTHHAHHCLH
jgi:Zn-dependent protease with chaperone function